MNTGPRTNRKERPPAGPVLVQDLGAGDVARHEVRGELHPPELEVHRVRHRAHHECLGQPGHPDQQRVSAGEQRHEDFVDRVPLADNASTDLLTQLQQVGDELFLFVRHRAFGNAPRRLHYTASERLVKLKSAP